ncbi:thiamine diphosphokinase [Oscillospiraceae bacterium OttesenSCG-928-G22]|nr:thiamine diphosphokinase [Oscillospiraceae bacterium OttesenSCG-928-G22]
MRGAIFGSSDEGGLAHIKKYMPFDFVVCADGGMQYAHALGLSPDLLVGDFDSGGAPEDGVPVLSLPVAKDVTDLEAALDAAIERGVRELFLFGCSGGRLDHFLANVFLLERAEKRGAPAVLVNAQNELRYLRNGELAFLKGGDFTYLSLVPIDERITGVDITGVRFPLDNATLDRSGTLGISNQITDDIATVRVRSGAAIVILSRDSA